MADVQHLELDFSMESDQDQHEVNDKPDCLLKSEQNKRFSLKLKKYILYTRREY